MHKSLEQIHAEAMDRFVETLLAHAVENPDNAPMLFEMANDVLKRTCGVLTVRGRITFGALRTAMLRNVS